MDRLSPDDYYREALVILGEYGSEAMTIAALCDRLEITKGSFYHHFASMSGFVEGLLAYWEQEHSERLIAISRAQPDAALRMLTLIDFAVELPHASEAAIRAWGRSNPAVAEVTARVDRKRERHVVDSVVALGLERTRARLLGRMSMSLLIGVQQREQPVDAKRLRQMLEEINTIIVAEADPALVAPFLAARAG